jgi:hypothetical protein
MADEKTPEEETLAAEPIVPVSKYDPRKDPGPKRIEDHYAEGAVDPKVYDKRVEVPLEDSVKDHTTILATDTFDSEGNVTNRKVPKAPDLS